MCLGWLNWREGEEGGGEKAPAATKPVEASTRQCLKPQALGSDRVHSSTGPAT